MCVAFFVCSVFPFFPHTSFYVCPQFLFYFSIPLPATYHKIYLAPEKFQCIRKFDLKIYTITFVMFWIHIIYTPCIRWHFRKKWWPFFGNFFFALFLSLLWIIQQKILGNITFFCKTMLDVCVLACPCVWIFVQWDSFLVRASLDAMQIKFELLWLMAIQHIKCPMSNTHAHIVFVS